RVAGATVLLSYIALSQQALAQSVARPDENGGGLEEIVVTSQRRTENSQGVPLALTALSLAQLKEHNINQIADLQATAPNVTFGSTAQGVQSSPPGIRGLRNQNIELVNEHPTAVYIDGVYQATSLGSMTFLGPDTERIEILRGPQGTLFGRN